MTCVKSINVYPSSVTIKKGEWYYGAYAVISPDTATCCEVVWHSSNTSVATVNASSGYIYAKADGTARIYATATDGSGQSDYITVNVTSVVKISSVELNKSMLSLKEGQTYAFSPEIYPTDATNKNLIWSSDNTEVAIVENGIVTAVGVGTAVITAVAEDGSWACDCCEIKIEEKILIDSISMVDTYEDVYVGRHTYLKTEVKILPNDATNKTLSWRSENEEIAIVNEHGVVTGKKLGKTRITVTTTDGSNKSDWCYILVQDVPTVQEVSISSTYKQMSVGGKLRLKATVYPNNVEDKSITWKSSNTDVATIGECDGIVTAKKRGVVLITATAINGVKATCNIHVDRKEKVVVRKEMSRYLEGYFTVEFEGKDKNNLPLIWKSIGCNLSADTYPTEAMDRYNDNRKIIFTIDQIAYLYLLDPLGVSHYVKYYTSKTEDMDPFDFLMFKDNIYKTIFGSFPQLTCVSRDGTCDRYLYSLPMSKDWRERCYSDAELIFGEHKISPTVEEIVVGFIDVVKEIIVTAFAAKYEAFAAVVSVSEFVKLLFFSGAVQDLFKTGSLSAAELYVKDYIGMSMGKIDDVKKTTDAIGKMFNWVGCLLDVLNIISDTFVIPNTNDIVIYNKAKSQTNYRAYFVIDNDEIAIEELIDNAQLATE